MPNPSRWLVTINGRVVTAGDLDCLGQHDLADALDRDGLVTTGWARRSIFDQDAAAEAFHANASREFPEDAVRLWASVGTSTNER